MANVAFRRIQKECQEVITSKEIQESGITVEILNDNLTNIKGTISGPPDSPYEGGSFEINIVIPEQYPFHPPKCEFITKVWHPNISSQTGVICLDILKDKWTAVFTLRTVLLSIQLLMVSPEPNDPQDAIVAQQYISNLSHFKQTAMYWTTKYAKGNKPLLPEYRNLVQKLREKGALEDEAISMLSLTDWDLSKATSLMFD